MRRPPESMAHLAVEHDLPLGPTADLPCRFFLKLCSTRVVANLYGVEVKSVLSSCTYIYVCMYISEVLPSLLCRHSQKLTFAPVYWLLIDDWLAYSSGD